MSQPPSHDELRDALKATWEDLRLSRSESQALRQVVADFADDPQRLAFVRNTAFRIAEQHVQDAPALVLEWLERVDKIVDNADRCPAQARPAFASSPGDACLDLIVEHLRRARTSIDICVFTITDDRITREIIARHDAGLAIRILSDNDKRHDSGSDVFRLAKAGVPVRVDPTPNHMHHKFAVFDAEVALTGSYNWTRGATRNHENLIALSDPALVSRFADLFDRLWAEFA